jgi:hypothetical protein
VAAKSILLSRAERYDEALAAATQSFDSPVVGQASKVDSLLPAVNSLAALGRYEEALAVVQKDFGPMINALRPRLMGSQLVALLSILHHLQRHERVYELVAVAYAYGHNLLGFDQGLRAFFADNLGGDDALAKLPTPDPADLATDRIASLIDGLVAEIRDIIAHRTPGQLAEAPAKAT